MSSEETNTERILCLFINCLSERIDLYKTGWMLDSAVSSVESRDILFSAVAPAVHLVDISHDSHCQPLQALCSSRSEMIPFPRSF